MTELRRLHELTHACEACPRLRAYCLRIAREKRRSYADQEYWGKPISGFGDPLARLVVVGLAPAAHGANRTGRIFTGDRSGDWLYRALHKAGFANQPEALGRDDGLRLQDAYVTCVVKCAPPDNKPASDELKRCIALHLVPELESLSRARVFIALGRIALDGLWPLLAPGEPRPSFRHGARVRLDTSPGPTWLLLSYHPSQQNTFTGRLTEPMFDGIFSAARELLRKTP
ncbi:MAG: uracil-DNA glycosylase [Oligoflexia bacterium]|nr:uracil-DNA glycosylase [Oligoflexia bacterium]